MTRKRAAIIGLGMAVKPHAESYLQLTDRVEVTHAFSPTKARRDAFAGQYGFPITDDIDAIVADPTVDYVTILTPPNTHLELTQRCAAAGKHVLLEKPLEISTDRARALVAASRGAGVRLGMVLQHRFRPSGARLREIMASGKLGATVGASVGVLNWRPQSYYDQPGRDDGQDVEHHGEPPTRAGRDLPRDERPIRFVEAIVLQVVVLIDDVGGGVEQPGTGGAQQDRPQDARRPLPGFAGQSVRIRGRAPRGDRARDDAEQGRQQREGPREARVETGCRQRTVVCHSFRTPPQTPS
ncbi:MAG: Gfo/Idh/MocA family oxidoreductase [Pseudomonadota bacterium]